MSVMDWSQTASVNDTADILAGIDLREGMSPALVNDSMRAMMAGVAAMLSDQGGGSTVSGTANDVVLTLAQTPKTAGRGPISFVPTADNTGTMTLKVTVTGTAVAYPLRVASGVEIEAGGVKAGRRYTASFNPATSEYLLAGQNRVLADLQALIQSIAAPVGKIDGFFRTSAPAGWLVCNGSAYSRTAYPALNGVAASFGYAFPYGPGDGSTTFNVPNVCGRALIGLDPAQSTVVGANVIGALLGEQSHTLSIAEMPSHDHGGSTSGENVPHSHGYNQAASDGTTGSGTAGPAYHVNNAATTSGPSNDHIHGVSPQGGGQAHNNVQPSIVALICIKT